MQASLREKEWTSGDLKHVPSTRPHRVLPFQRRQFGFGPLPARAGCYHRAMITTQTGLRYEDTAPGQGAAAKAGQTCVMHYTGWLWTNGAKGAKFDSSRDRGSPFSFKLGAGQVIAGWDEGIVGIQLSGKRTLLIPPELGYGARGAGGIIPPNATLLFEVELLELR